MAHTLEALALVALADVAGAIAAGGGEAFLPEVRQQDDAPAFHLLLAVRHLPHDRAIIAIGHGHQKS